MRKWVKFKENESKEEGKEGIYIVEEMNVNDRKSINNNENGFWEGNYDKGKGLKNKYLIKNIITIREVKDYITKEGINNKLNLPPDKAKICFNNEKDHGMIETINLNYGNIHDLKSNIGKIIYEPPIPEELINNMSDRFRFKKFQDIQIDLKKRNKKKLKEMHKKMQQNFDISLKIIFSKVEKKINDLLKEQNHFIDEKVKAEEKVIEKQIKPIKAKIY